MGILWALLLWFIAAAIIGVCEENDNYYKGKKKDEDKTKKEQ